MYKHLRLVFIAGILVLLFAGCLEPDVPISCDKLLAKPLHNYVSKNITLQTAVDIIEESYNLQPEEIHVHEDSNGSWTITWFTQDVGYGVFSDNGTTLAKVGVAFQTESVQPTAGRIVECLEKQPQWYWAAFGSDPRTSDMRYNFTMYFPEDGIMAISHGYREHSEIPSMLNPDIRIDGVAVIQPGSLSGMYQQVWNENLGSVRDELQPKPWPNAWEAVEFIEDNEPDW